MNGPILIADPSLRPGRGGEASSSLVAERLARSELRRQIGRLELELAGLTFDGFGRLDVPHRVAAAAPGPRMLDLGELERLRDGLAERAGEARAALEAKIAAEAAARELLRDLIASPGEHRWLRISRAEVGEPGCGHWHSLPRLGPIGMLMGWWGVVVSSGCPRPGRLAAADRVTVDPRLRIADGKTSNDHLHRNVDAASISSFEIKFSVGLLDVQGPKGETGPAGSSLAYARIDELGKVDASQSKGIGGMAVLSPKPASTASRVSPSRRGARWGRRRVARPPSTPSSATTRHVRNRRPRSASRSFRPRLPSRAARRS